MGLLDKTNPKATGASVMRNMLLQGAVGALAYLLVVHWNKPLHELSFLKLSLWSLGCALIGGLYEWQVCDEDNEEIET